MASFVCVAGRRFCLWNPATKQSTNLPILPVVPHCYCFVGFGFDLKTNDYKLVCVNYHLCKFKNTFHVYSLSSDSWRVVEGVDLTDVFIQNDPKTPYRNGIYCWSALVVTDYSKSDEVGAILSFDFNTEVFRTIPLPDSVGKTVHGLFFLRENIACIKNVGESSNENPESWYYEVWMLNDYDVKDSWTRLYSVQLYSSNFLWVTWFSMNGDFLLFLESNQLCMYDLVTQEIMNLPPQVGYRYEVVTYQESLVSVRRGSGAVIGGTYVDRNGRMLISQSISRDTDGRCDIDITNAIVFRILLWLPVVSLLRFKSVCRSWCTLIKSSNFVSQHLHHRRQQYGTDNINLILHTTDTVHYSLFEDSSSPCPNTSCTCLLSANKFELLDFPYFDPITFRHLTFTTSFNGIICLRSDGCDVFLWNPATKQIRHVLVEKRNSCPVKGEYRFGFGFDAKTNDYKLVRFHEAFGSRTRKIFQVYSLSTDSWRTIEDKHLLTIEKISTGLQSPYGNSVYCWLAETVRITGSHMILWFDFSNEEFRAIPLPEGINQSLFSFDLTVLKENIVCICTVKRYLVDEGETCPCEIWMLSEYGINESWTKLYTFRPFSGYLYVQLGYSKKNRDYILLQEDSQLYEYDLVTQETKRLPVPVQRPEDYQVLLYEESLVPIKRGFC